jgi:hypothetical protein
VSPFESLSCSYNDLFQWFSNSSPKIDYISRHNYTRLYKEALDGNTSKLAFFIDEFEHKLMNTTFKNSLAIMKGEMLTKMNFLHITKKNILVRHFDQVMERLVPAGIPQYLNDLGYSTVFPQIYEEEIDNRRILSLSDLEFGFVIWLALFPIPIIAFICELCSMKLKRMGRKLAGLIEFLLLLRARMSVYHG